MSHIKLIATQMTDAGCMQTALEKFVGPENVVCAENPFAPSLRFRDYFGHMRTEKASFVVKREALHTHADLGVIYQADGSFSFVMDDMDRWDTEQIGVEYNVALVYREYPQEQWEVVRNREPNGDVILELVER